MNILADENIDPPVIDWLRSQGHDVFSVRESAPGATDFEVLEIATSHDRILLTQDKDFGELIFRNGMHTHGVILMRFDSRSASETIILLEVLWPDLQKMADRNFLILTNDRIRVRPLPLRE